MVQIEITEETYNRLLKINQLLEEAIGPQGRDLDSTIFNISNHWLGWWEEWERKIQRELEIRKAQTKVVA